MTNPIFTLEDVTYCYPGVKKPALENIQLQIEPGEFVGVVGANGAGKSTLCYCLNGLIPQSVGGKLNGKVTVRGIDTTKATTAEIAQWVGLVFSNPEAQLTQLTVAEEVSFGPANLGRPLEEIRHLVGEILRMVQLEGMEERNTHSLSGGQQQRLAIGSVLAMDPEILVLDEPTSNLDPQGVQEVFTIATRLNRENGTTVVMVEQQINLLAQFASRIVVLEMGKIIADGTPEQVFSQVERLKQAGVQSPEVTSLFYQLDQAQDIHLNHNSFPVTVSSARERLAPFLIPKTDA